MLVILDAGHGGIINGQYVTPGKRSPVWSDGSQLFEGEFNRAIVEGLSERLTARGIQNVKLVPEQQDIDLPTRMQRANQYADQPSIFISVHANAGGGNGFEVFTSVGTTLSDTLAHCFGEAFKQEFPDRRLRADMADGDYDKDKNYFVLKHTRMPAVLTENFFMDTEEECRGILMSNEGRQRIIRYHEHAVLAFLQNQTGVSSPQTAQVRPPDRQGK